LSKRLLKRDLWASSAAAWNRRDNWDDNANFVVAEKTTGDDAILKFEGDLSSVPASGEILEQIHRGDSVLVRGIFPIFDASHAVAGGMFVVRDISGVYRTLRQTQTRLIVLSVSSLLIGALVLIVLLNRVVFRRLQHIIGVATRVVGGDYDSAIQVSSTDEIGQFERLFEQFRCVFVDALQHTAEVEQKK